MAKISESPIGSRTTPGYPVDIISTQRNELTAAYKGQNTLPNPARRKQTHLLFGHLSDWQADLLRFTMIYDTHVHLLANSGATIVTDGGVEGGKGYFGVTLAFGKMVVARVRRVAQGDPRSICVLFELKPMLGF